MRESDIVDRLRRIDNYQAKISDLIDDIRESGHPSADDIAEALLEQCWFPASAEHVGIDFLDGSRWALRKTGSSFGGIVSRAVARKAGIEVDDA